MGRYLRAVIAVLVVLALPLITASASGAVLISDHFDGTAVDAGTWHIPTWVSSNDGSYVGRTQFRVTQRSQPPTVSGSNVRITVETFNPTGFSFWGTNLISDRSFAVGQGLRVAVRAKMDSPEASGVVGGIFLYSLRPGSSTLHDEIDFELLGNRPNQVQTNIYGAEPLGVGHPVFVPYASGSATDYHLYEIDWLPSQVSWYVDGRLVRTVTSHVPAGPMYLHLNMWAPDVGWAEAYSPAIQPTSSPSSNQVFSMSVDSVDVTSRDTVPSTTVTLSSVSGVVGFGGPAAITGSLAGTGGPVAGAAVHLQTSLEGRTFTDAGRQATTTAEGDFRFTLAPTSRTYYRVVFAGSDTLLASTSGVLCLTPRVYLTAPGTPSTIGAGRSFALYGCLKPRHTAGSRAVRVDCYRYDGRAWRLVKSVWTSTSNYLGYSRYSARTSLLARDRWRMRAHHAGDAANAATYSGWRYVTVR